MTALIILLAIEVVWLIFSATSINGIQGLEAIFAFFAFIGLAFLVMNIFNTTFPSIAINAGAHKSSISGLKKEDFRSELDEKDPKKRFVLFNKTNASYLVFFLINAFMYTVVYLIMY